MSRHKEKKHKSPEITASPAVEDLRPTDAQAADVSAGRNCVKGQHFK
jgi:hypothetical protein